MYMRDQEHARCIWRGVLRGPNRRYIHSKLCSHDRLAYIWVHKYISHYVMAKGRRVYWPTRDYARDLKLQRFLWAISAWIAFIFWSKTGKSWQFFVCVVCVYSRLWRFRFYSRWTITQRQLRRPFARDAEFTQPTKYQSRSKCRPRDLKTREVLYILSVLMGQSRDDYCGERSARFWAIAFIWRMDIQ